MGKAAEDESDDDEGVPDPQEDGGGHRNKKKQHRKKDAPQEGSDDELSNRRRGRRGRAASSLSDDIEDAGKNEDMANDDKTRRRGKNAKNKSSGYPVQGDNAKKKEEALEESSEDDGGGRRKDRRKKKDESARGRGAGLKAHGKAQGRGTAYEVFYDSTRDKSGPGRGHKNPELVTCAAFRCHHGKHFKAETTGDLRATSSNIGDSEKFYITYHEDGFVSLSSCHGKYVGVERNGDLRVNRDTIGDQEKFEIVYHEDGSISIRSLHGFVAADKGSLKANRTKIGAWERFQIKPRSGKPSAGVADHAAAEPRSPVQAPEKVIPFFDACCELESVLQFARKAPQRKLGCAGAAAGRELTLRSFRELQAYPPTFRGCVSSWDVTALLAADCERLEPALLSDEDATDVHAAFGIPAGSAAEVNENTLATLRELCGNPRCVAVGPVGLDFTQPDGPQPELKRGHEGLSLPGIITEFGVPPTAAYQPAQDPMCAAWIAGGGANVEAWTMRHGDRRAGEFKAVCWDYASRRLEKQSDVVAAQVRLARDLGLAVIIQIPPQDDAERHMAEILLAELAGDPSHLKQRLILSCFRGRPRCVVSMQKAFPNLYVGFSGLLTHSKLKDCFTLKMGRCSHEKHQPKSPL
eukprot:TRINITY_DN29899_c0_g1_i2.p1 TRINITY_DN29899_c0_g1~~TRINITY_DN29899_c0_g1_i2.p1  ORF type:complete len:636 (+),score=112.75 TRINITY_DN29899_c0_g1_i2:103-2010(+)